MKIRINGETIDTINIYKIGKVEYFNDINPVYLTIYLYNKKEIRVSLDGKVIHGVHVYCRKSKEERDEIFQGLIKRMEEYRSEIEKVWSENQSAIPEFNL